MRNLNQKRIIFLTIGESGYSRSWTYYNGARKLGAQVEFKKIDNKNLIRSFWGLRNQCSSKDVYVVMSPSHYLVIFVRLFLGKTIILDAGWSLFEGTILARKNYGFFGWLIFKTYLIDFFSSHLATKIILESDNQKIFFCKIFLIRMKKTAVLYTGLDELSINDSPSHIELPDFFNNSKIVLFRGKYNRESGIEVLAAATNLLTSEDITFWILCPGLPEDILFSRFTYVNRNYIESSDELFNIYKKAQLTIGQLSANIRLSRTIPHKAFEAAYLSKPYITARQPAIIELFLEDKEIICIDPADYQELASKIKSLILDKHFAEKIGLNMHRKYCEKASQEILAKLFIEIVLGKVKENT